MQPKQFKWRCCYKLRISVIRTLQKKRREKSINILLDKLIKLILARAAEMKHVIVCISEWPRQIS